jgi:hypothetical protein
LKRTSTTSPSSLRPSRLSGPKSSLLHYDANRRQFQPCIRHPGEDQPNYRVGLLFARRKGFVDGVGVYGELSERRFRVCRSARRRWGQVQCLGFAPLAFGAYSLRPGGVGHRAFRTLADQVLSNPQTAISPSRRPTLEFTCRPREAFNLHRKEAS